MVSSSMSSSFGSPLSGSESESVIGLPSPSKVSVISAVFVKLLLEAPYTTFRTIFILAVAPGANGPGIIFSAVLAFTNVQPLASFGLSIEPGGIMSTTLISVAVIPPSLITSIT